MRAYRPEVDGLRAVAVLLVMLYHFHIGPFHGGFVGVDVFFVISGFLITGIVARELVEERFSLAHFYERRVRRILPALTVVGVVTYIAALFVLFPPAMVEFGKSLIAAAGFSANMFFWATAGYFNYSVWEKPFVHTWSLGVEEQFYLVFPLLLMLLARGERGRRAAPWVIAGFAALSFAAAIYARPRWPDADFYVMPFRFWELALGGLLALVPRLRLKGRWINEAAFVAGLALIVGGGILTVRTYFPGLATAPPCIGAALVIATGDRTPYAARMLSNRVVRGIGQISYSLYLWHWPLQALVRVRFNNLDGVPHGHLLRWGLLASSFAFAYLSWRFVEQPFRRPDFISRRGVFGAAMAASAILVLAGVLAVGFGGWPGRLPLRALALATAANDVSPQAQSDCLGKGYSDGVCLIGDPAAPVTALLWGDSHAAAFAPAVGSVLAARHLRGIVLQHSFCIALPPGASEARETFRECPAFNMQVRAYLAAHPQITDVILAGRWMAHAESFPAGAFQAAMAAQVQALQSSGHKIFIIASMPEMDYDVPACLARRAAFGAVYRCPPLSANKVTQRQAPATQAFASFGASVTVFNPQDVLCLSGICAQGGPTGLYYFDDNHPSLTGALLLAPAMRRAFMPALP